MEMMKKMIYTLTGGAGTLFQGIHTETGPRVRFSGTPDRYTGRTFKLPGVDDLAAKIPDLNNHTVINPDGKHDFWNKRLNAQSEIFVLPAGQPKPLPMHPMELHKKCKGHFYPTPLKVKIEAMGPFRPEDLPTVYMKAIPSPEHCQTLKLDIESPDVHTVVTPHAYFL